MVFTKCANIIIFHINRQFFNAFCRFVFVKNGKFNIKLTLKLQYLYHCRRMSGENVVVKLEGFLQQDMDCTLLSPQCVIQKRLPGFERFGRKVDAVKNGLLTVINFSAIHCRQRAFLLVAGNVIYHPAITNNEWTRNRKLQRSDATHGKVGSPAAHYHIVESIAIIINQVIVGDGILSVKCGNVWPAVRIYGDGCLVDKVGARRDVHHRHSVLSRENRLHPLAIVGFPCVTAIVGARIINSMVGIHIALIVAPKPRKVHDILLVDGDLPVWAQMFVVFQNIVHDAPPTLFTQKITVHHKRIDIAVYKQQVTIGKIIKRRI